MRPNIPHPMDRTYPGEFYDGMRAQQLNTHASFPPHQVPPVTPPMLPHSTVENVTATYPPRQPQEPYTCRRGINVKATFDNYLLDPFITISAGGMWVRELQVELTNVASLHASSEDGEIIELKFNNIPRLKLVEEWKVAGVSVSLDQNMTDYIVSHLTMYKGELQFEGDAIDVLEQASESVQLQIHSEFIKARLAELVNEFEFSIKEIEFVEHVEDEEDEYEEKYEYDIAGVLEARYTYNGVRYGTEFKFIMPKWGYTPLLVIDGKEIYPETVKLLKLFLDKFIAGEFKNGE